MRLPTRRRLAALALLLPGLLPLLVLFLVPFVWSILGSIGLDADHAELTSRHYVDIVMRPALQRALVMSAYYGIVPVLGTLPIAISLALVLRRHFFGRALFNGLYKIPMAVPGIIAALVVMTLFDRGGFADRVLAPMGLSLPRMVRDPWGIGVILTLIWKQVPLMTLVISGALASIPEDIGQAARSLGAGRWRALWLVELPLALPSLSVAALLSFISNLGSYAVPDLLGPASPKPLAVHMVEEFGLGNLGAVDAMGVVLSVFAAVVMVGQELLTRPALNPGDSHDRPGRST